MSGLATPGDHLLQPSFRLIVIFIKVIPRRALPIVESRLLYRRLLYRRTNQRPGLCYPAKDQQKLAAECRRLKSMLVPDKRPLLEISSCAHARCENWPTSEALTEPLTQGAAFGPSRSFYGDPLLFDQATFGVERKLKMDDCFDRAAGRAHRKTKVMRAYGT